MKSWPDKGIFQKFCRQRFLKLNRDSLLFTCADVVIIRVGSSHARARDTISTIMIILKVGTPSFSWVSGVYTLTCRGTLVGTGVSCLPFRLEMGLRRETT